MNNEQLYRLITEAYPGNAGEAITTDSRHCPKGSTFLALKGASFNGNEFALQALQQGCAYAIIDEDIDNTTHDDSQLAALSPQLIKVDNCLQTYKDLAREHRRRFNIPVVAITGTNGKTTTKELIRAVLAEKYNVDLMTMVGFLDGINDSLKEANPIDDMEEDTEVSLEIVWEKLYYNMCKAKAPWLYELKEWEGILDADKRIEIRNQYRKDMQAVSTKVGRNDPCPCGSGKKYKKCCGKDL